MEVGRLRPILLAVLLAFATLSSGRAAPLPVDDPDRARQALDTGDWPWVAIGRVNRATGGHCTGTLVRADAVLTAAHCLRAPGGGFLRPESVHFTAGWRRGGFVAHARGAAFRRPPAHTPADDWALILLARPLAVEPVPLAQGSLPLVAAVTQAGYGRDRPHLLSRNARCAIEGRHAGLLLHDCDAVPGDSGSPLLLATADGWAVAAVATGVALPQAIGIAVPVEAAAAALAALPPTGPAPEPAEAR